MERRGVSPNEVSYNTAIRACGDAGRLSEALALMDEMERKGVKASVVTYGTAVSACQRQGDWKMVRGTTGKRTRGRGRDKREAGIGMNIADDLCVCIRALGRIDNVRAAGWLCGEVKVKGGGP